MNRTLLKLILTPLLFCSCCQTEVKSFKAERVKVDVYYETHCPDSILFLNYQLQHVISRGLVDVELIPFGKASYWRNFAQNDWNFMCQHGEIECFGNKLHVSYNGQLIFLHYEKFRGNI